MRRSAAPWVAVLLVVVISTTGFVDSPAASAPTEPPAPKPTEVVQKLLEESAQHGQAKEYPKALAAGDRALAAAREAHDGAGEARAQGARGRALEGLGRTQEAVAAWQAAEQAWERAGEGPGQVEALAAAALLLAATKPAEALVARAVAVGRAEAKRPLAAAQALHAAGRASYAQNRLVPARDFWTAAAALREKLDPDSLDLAHSLNNLGAVSYSQGDLAAARDYHQRALAIYERRDPNSLTVADSLNNLGDVALAQGDLAAEKTYYQRALALREQLAPGSQDVATNHSALGDVARRQGDLAAAREHYQRTLAIREKLAPNSLDLADSLNRLGIVASSQGDLMGARDSLQRALEIRKRLAPDSLAVADTLNNLGIVARSQGDLAEAQDCYQRALAIRQKLTPNSLAVAGSLNNLGTVAHDQGDLARAQEYYQRALAIKVKLAPRSLDVAGSLNNLGNVAGEQEDLAAAQEYHRRALAIREKLAPGSMETAHSLNSLGTVAEKQGDLAGAREYYQRALAIQEKAAPNSLDLANTLHNLGNVASDQGDLSAAQGFRERALAIREKLAPDSLDLAHSFEALGHGAKRQGDLATAERYYQRALAIAEKLAPNSMLVAAILHHLIVVVEGRGNWPEAEQRARQAWAAVRHQAAAVAGDEARQAFGSSTADYAAHLVRAQLALGNVAAAFVTLEEGRAQALQQLLRERRLDLQVAPAPLQAEYRSALLARDRAEGAVSRAGVGEALARRALAGAQEPEASSEEQARRHAAVEAAKKGFAAAQAAYTQARVQADQLWSQIQQHTPRAFATPLSPAQASRALPHGTLFLAFAVGDHQTHLFLLRAGRKGSPALAGYTLPLTLLQLQGQVAAFRAQVTDRLADRKTTVTASRAFFAQLFPDPARTAVLGARRLLISPDGPLWEVPFAALVTNTQGPPHYLGAEKPLTYTQSLTLFAQSHADRPRLASGHKPLALVVGNPLFDRPWSRRASAQGASADIPSSGVAGTPRPSGERAFMVDDSHIPGPLPATGPEAVAIARLYGSAPLTQVAATEAALRQRIGQADVVHLATHGFLLPKHAMSSGLLLTPPVKEPAIGETGNDGVLQAWEIYSQLKLRAELVVLSACETGRGQNVAAEGIVGLTRALQYAGARSVVASQWKVADASTAALMVAFHEKVRAGMAKDEALRQAIALVRSNPRTWHPYYWAAFFLTGDPDNPTLGADHGGRRVRRTGPTPTRWPHTPRQAKQR